MRRINLEPLMTLSDGSQLVISTQHSRDGDLNPDTREGARP